MRTEERLITPDLAKIYLQKNKNNRPLRAKTVDYYASVMNRNLWKLTGQGLSFTTAGNIVDGQHRLSAVVKSGVSVKFLIIYDVPEDTFDVYDTGKIRSVSDVMSIEGIKNTTVLAGAIAKYFKLKRNNVAIKINNTELKLTSHDYIQEYYKHPDLFQELLTFASSCYFKYRMYSKTEILSIAFYLVVDKKHSIEKVKEFFQQLYQMRPTTNKSIDVLRNTLLKDAFATKKMDIRYKLILLIKTWNYFITNREIKILKHNIELDNKVYLM